MDFRAAREAFPITKKMVYMNNGSIGAMSAPVIEAVNAFLGEVRDSGRNQYPQWCRHADNEIKADIGRLIGCEAGELAYVKNTTEGLLHVARGVDWQAGDSWSSPTSSTRRTCIAGWTCSGWAWSCAG